MDQKLTEAIQNLTASARPAPSPLPRHVSSPTHLVGRPTRVSQHGNHAPDTLELPPLLKLYDSLFHDVYQT
ncbi:hypothetical protein GJ744_011407 [Endocarpon pusillum]|uniref:Uncharacterized protein n=1 Tax=Endocarpon pusillum TaxID=364733 RepID=A0A8H7AKJ0_9EURO|nr:hypothetical protein GJ744_011407 [Endocarpon pusillum]